MTHPQQPELSRNDKGQTTQDGRAANAVDQDNPAESGNTGPTPAANRSEDQRHSGTKSTTLDALRED